ncbi:MAG: efflux RND transporter periplasmic adaptor subunit, partial [Limisphaerales bacterium]
VRYGQQQHFTQLHEKMYGEQIIPRLELLEEQMKLQVAETVMTNKLTLAKKAEERVAELNRQVKLQQAASVNMPFDGVVWSSPAKDGAQVAAHETVAEVINPERVWVDASFHERHAGNLEIGCVVNIQTKGGRIVARGRVESIRGGGGRTPSDGVATFSPGAYGHRKIAARMKLESPNRFRASEFLGVGRAVVVTLERR